MSESPITSGRRAAIAASIDGLGNKFKHELREAWLAYIRETYPYGPVAEPDNADIMGTARWRLMIEFLMLLDCMLANPPWWMDHWQVFCIEYASKCRF
jgi:hypothetical protein